MPQPTPGDVHINRPLTNVSVAHFQSQTDFVTSQAGVTVPVEKQTDSIVKFKKGAFYRDEMGPLAPGAEGPVGGWEMDSPLTYYCPTKSYAHDIADMTRANTDMPINQDRAATRLITRKGLIASDRLFASRFLVSGSGWDVKRQGVASGAYVEDTNVIKWSDYANSNPILDVSFYCTKVQLASGGFRPRSAVTTRRVWDKLKDHPDFIALISGGADTSKPSIVSRRLVAEKFELDNLYVMESVYDQAAENATFNPAFIGGDAFLLYYTPTVAALEEPSAFYRFAWKGFTGTAEGQFIKKFRMEHIGGGSDRIQIITAYDWKLMGADMATLMYDLI